MIGIDVITISRFNNIDLTRLGKKLGTELKTSKDAAKTWTCLEALYKASSIKFHFKDIQIIFNKNSSPVIIDQKNMLGARYILSLTHENDICIAVAIRDPSYN
jgi:phosphopantetheinyl transferase (holo-ACP synthase)